MTSLLERREVVADLREQGHSQRAIAGALGVTRRTVRDDLSGGRTRPPVSEGALAQEQIRREEMARHVPVRITVPERVRGTDGKSYPAKTMILRSAGRRRKIARQIKVRARSLSCRPRGSEGISFDAGRTLQPRPHRISRRQQFDGQAVRRFPFAAVDRKESPMSVVEGVVPERVVTVADDPLVVRLAGLLTLDDEQLGLVVDTLSRADRAALRVKIADPEALRRAHKLAGDPYDGD